MGILIKIIFMDTFFTVFVVVFIAIVIYTVIKKILSPDQVMTDKKPKGIDVQDPLFMQNSSNHPNNLDFFSNNLMNDLTHNSHSADVSFTTNDNSISSNHSSSDF